MRTDYIEGCFINNCQYLKELPTSKNWARNALFKCFCGKEFNARIEHIKTKAIQSCGCLNSKLSSERKLKHGQSKRGNTTVEYTTWSSIKSRCYDCNNKSYNTYGGRGIIMCDRWLNSFESFYDDMGERPSNKHSIDRIDPNGNYEPDNCRWVTKDIQDRNRRNNRFLEYDGQKLILSDWARILNIHTNTLSKRLKKFTIEEIIKNAN